MIKIIVNIYAGTLDQRNYYSIKSDPLDFQNGRLRCRYLYTLLSVRPHRYVSYTDTSFNDNTMITIYLDTINPP